MTAQDTTRIASRRPTLPERAPFIVATASFALVFASAGAPIPMYHLYREDNGLTDGDFAFASAGYFVAAVTSLLLLGRLSNHLGRRPVAIAALASAGIGAGILAFIDQPSLLIVARVLQGLAAGIAPSAIGAFAIDTAPERPRWLPALVTGSTPMLGIPLGAISAGLVVDLLPHPRAIVSITLVALTLLMIVLVLLCGETMPRSRGAVASLAPRLHVPAGRGRVLLATGTAAIATWSLGAFFQAFAPTVASEYLGTDDALIAACVFSAMMILNPVGGPLAGKLSPRAGVRLGMGIYMVALTGIILTLDAGAIVPFMAATLVVGIAQGIASTSAMRALVTGLEQHERAGLLASVYLMSYSGAALPGLISGRVAGDLTSGQILLGYSALGVLSAIVAMVAIGGARRAAEARPGEGSTP